VQIVAEGRITHNIAAGGQRQGLVREGSILICNGVVRVAGVECNEPPVNHDWGLTTFDPSHPDTCKLRHYFCERPRLAVAEAERPIVGPSVRVE
jgi:hypothetical protein